MLVLHFGAGNIGRGFIGKLLAEAGAEVVFADVNQQVIDLLNQNRQYGVNVVGEGVNRIDTVKNVRGVNSQDLEALRALILSADLITTAVGANVLKIIAPTLAQILPERQKPLNIIACENMVRGTTFLKEQMGLHLKEVLPAHIGFVDSAVDRIVPPAQPNENDPLMVTVEEFCEWIVDKTQFVGDVPNIAGMELTDNLMAFVERKLFTLNTGHATCAYLGVEKGLPDIRQSILDADIQKTVRAVMNESGAVLIRRYGFYPEAHAQYIEKIIKRFANPFLVDDVNRVGREPIRKISPNERLIKPLRGTLEYGLPHEHLLLALVGALRYRNHQDNQALELAESIEQNGVKATVQKYCEIHDENLLNTIQNLYQK